MQGQTESLILQGVVNRLRSCCGYSESECEVELDEQFPAIVDDLYVAVIPAGITPGPRHNTAGRIFDYLYAVSVVIVQRTRNIARDRQRNVMLARMDSLAAEISKIDPVLDFNYDTMNAINATIDDGQQGLVEPLRFQTADARPRVVSPDLFASNQTQQAGLMRSFTYGAARRITNK